MPIARRFVTPVALPQGGVSNLLRRAVVATLCVLATGFFSPSARSNMLIGDEEEQGALRSLDSDKLIRAREQAEAILRSRPDSFIATWVLANVFHTEESNLPRALFLLRKAKGQFEDRFSTSPPEALAQKWHRKLLTEETWIGGEMDRREERLALIDRYNDL